MTQRYHIDVSFADELAAHANAVSPVTKLIPTIFAGVRFELVLLQAGTGMHVSQPGESGFTCRPVVDAGVTAASVPRSLSCRYSAVANAGGVFTHEYDALTGAYSLYSYNRVSPEEPNITISVARVTI